MKGMSITLIVKTQSGTDAFGAPIYTETTETVDDCLVGQPTTDDVDTALSLYGKKVAYVIGIPKDDEHDWADAEIVMFDEHFRVIGYPQTGIQDNIPLRWGQNIKVERYG